MGMFTEDISDDFVEVCDLRVQLAELKTATEMLLYSVEHDVSKLEFDMTVRNAKEAIAKVGSE